MALVGYTIGGKDEVTVSLYWQALGKPGRDYVVSVQLLDEAGRQAAQHDGPPVGGDYPTSRWEEGDTVLDVHRIALPPDARSGHYALSVVVYALETGTRLPIAENGKPLGDQLWLVTFPLR